MPAGFGGQQQPQRQGRVVSNQIPNGKTGEAQIHGWERAAGTVSFALRPTKTTMADSALENAAANASGWAFGGGNVPLSGGGIQNASRPLGGNASFAQTLGGSQPATPLDPSYVTLHTLSAFSHLAVTCFHPPHLRCINLCLAVVRPLNTCLLSVLPYDVPSSPCQHRGGGGKDISAAFLPSPFIVLKCV
jgi:hypothetical protein